MGCVVFRGITVGGECWGNRHRAHCILSRVCHSSMVTAFLPGGEFHLALVQTLTMVVRDSFLRALVIHENSGNQQD